METKIQQNSLAKLQTVYSCVVYAPNFNFVILEVFFCECAMTSTLMLGEWGDIRSKGRRTARTV